MAGLTQNDLPTGPQPQRSYLGFPLIASFVMAVLLLVAFYFWPSASPDSHSSQQAHLPYGPEEQSYADKLRLENPELSKAENFLHQEVVTFSGDLINGGDRALTGVELKIAFFDDMQQIVLRETRAVVSANEPPFAPGEHRHFEVAFDHIPPSWSQQQPSVQVAGLRFARAKE